MGPPRPARGVISIEACARPIAVDHRIRLPYYFRIAGSLLRQAKIYRDEKNILDLYVILLRYTSLLCETIPKHRDYPVFKSREAEFLRNANSATLIDVVNELESLKPVVKRQIAEYNRGGSVEANGLNGTHTISQRTEQHPRTTYSTQPLVGSNSGSLEKFIPGGRHQATSLPSVQTDRQIRKQFANLPFPKEETLARHSILGPNGLQGQWTGPVTAIKVQYPSNLEFTQSDMTSLVPVMLNQDVLHGSSTMYPDSTTKDNDDMKNVLSLDDGRWSAPAEECTSVPSVSLDGELSQLNIRQPSPPPVLAEVHPERRPISPSRIADPTPGLAISETGRYQNLHVPVKLMECFLRVAESNTKRSLETCGVLAGTLKKRTFYVTTLIIPKQKSTSDSFSFYSVKPQMKKNYSKFRTPAHFSLLVGSIHIQHSPVSSLPLISIIIIRIRSCYRRQLR
ncbi:AMSH-like ubiquitin thioesterase 3 isoform X2 [Brachypodium distachyon]|uniref:AMSH-like ubiquitin thioesterase 3 isoform X2 n=1 Tax=Brachypodium distachyon TaxID=15368 RepID=UPI0001C71E34|nr:AMSH-like ubiquitin thioesterase 3 isoform X2 [Brachypodium distachyon]|eukprot:XP_024315141.1 AMSH-like ubiquitin thioesterase 3 isoform X2 [Brachypodium distachyon]